MSQIKKPCSWLEPVPASPLCHCGQVFSQDVDCLLKEGKKEMLHLTTHSTHFIYSYMASHMWLRTILIVRKETRCCQIGYSYRLTARVLLYAPSHRQDNTYHVLCYTSRGALAGTINSSMVRSDNPLHHERTLLPQSYISLPHIQKMYCLSKPGTEMRTQYLPAH